MLSVGDDVFVKNYHHGDKWLPGVIQKKTGPVSFAVSQLTDGRVCRCHQDQVHRHSVEVPLETSVDSEVSVSTTEGSLSPTTPPEPPVPTNVEGPNAMDPTLVTKDTVFTPSNHAEKTYPKHMYSQLSSLHAWSLMQYFVFALVFVYELLPFT